MINISINMFSQKDLAPVVVALICPRLLADESVGNPIIAILKVIANEYIGSQLKSIGCVRLHFFPYETT